MASNIYLQYYMDGSKKFVRRSKKQGRIPSKLGSPFIQRLYEDDEEIIIKVKEKSGYLYNKNSFVRNAVKYYISNVYTELLKP